MQQKNKKKLNSLNQKINRNKYNLNQFEYSNCDAFNNVNISFVNSLRQPIQSKIEKTIHQLPSCFGITTASSMHKHNTKDLENIADIGRYEHLIRNRLGMKPLVGSIVFETNLRNYKILKSDNETSRYNSHVSRAQSVRQKTTPIEQEKSRQRRNQFNKYYQVDRSLDQGPYQGVREKNMSLYEYYLNESKNGTVKPGEIDWLVSLRSGKKQKKLLLK